jgi:hypothetical protein
VVLVDCKPHGYAPVLEQELLQGSLTGAVADTTTLTQAQQQAIRTDQERFEGAPV